MDSIEVAYDWVNFHLKGCLVLVAKLKNKDLLIKPKENYFVYIVAYALLVSFLRLELLGLLTGLGLHDL